jgi:tetratricopeptide (TPR) repeat protein
MMEFEEAVRRNPDLVPALVNLGHVKLVEGRWADAATQFEKALSQEPRWGLLRFCRQRRNGIYIFLDQLLPRVWSKFTVGG